ncbi:MAG: endonuclease V [Candidatus Saliniplasma sp.]
MPIPKIVQEFRTYFYDLVKQIPEGKVTTYGTLAEALGDKIASRAVGKMLNENPTPVIVPCHRVVMSTGDIGGFGMGVSKKKELLRDEGIKIINDRIQNFENVLFTEFRAEPVLDELRMEQKKAEENIRIKNEFDEYPELIGGVDVSYGEDKAYGSLSIWRDGEEIDNVMAEMQISFPYIPTYLSYRELPVLIKLLGDLNHLPDIVLVDGNGILHPRGIGLASHLGVELDISTVGVAKSQLLGKTDKKVSHTEPVQEIIVDKNGDKEVLGYAFISSSRAKNPIYVSPGHKVSFETSLEVVKDHCEYKVPSPIRNAHIAANEWRKKHE